MIQMLLGDPKPEIRATEKRRLLAQIQGPHVILETCDRVEVYFGNGSAPRQVLSHLVRVTAGLDSPILGEKAIQGQVKQAYLAAGVQGTLSSGLHGLFQKALALGRRIRSRTRLDWGAVSHAQGVQQILKAEGALKPEALVLVIGVNKLTGDILRWLRDQGGQQIILANRTLDRARALAADFDIRAESLRNLRGLLPQADVVITCTAAPHSIIGAEHLSGADFRPRWFFDLAAPPDLAPEIKGFPGARVFDLAAVEAQLASHRESRREEAQKAEVLLQDALDRIYKQGGSYVEGWTEEESLVPAAVG